jgi:MoaF N-terminal domain
MTATQQVPAIQGKTIRLTWTSSPTKGITHEHVFHDDGTVEWHDVKGSRAASPKERPRYAALPVTRDIYAVSYLSPGSGYTLTVILNFQDRRMVGFASSAKDWHPLEGTFDVVR